MRPEGLVRWATALLFLAGIWQACFFDLPLRNLLWNEALLSGPLGVLGVDWGDWVAGQGINATIIYLQYGFALLYTLGLAAIIWPALPARNSWILIAALGNAALFLLDWPDHFYQWGYLFEIALRLGTPFICWLLLRGKDFTQLHTVVRWLIALTFIGHGLYALGFYPRPAAFVNWTSAGLSLSENTAIQLLNLVGILDLITAIWLIIPLRKMWQLALYWIIPWAILTTLARYWANASFTDFSYLLYRWTPEVLERMPHVLLPLAIWFWLQSSSDAKDVANYR
ncbi:MAG: hypothetical protein AAF433_15810 [Bacteroidota bacterium]